MNGQNRTNTIEEQFTENQQAVQAKLKKVLKRVGRNPQGGS